MFTVVSYPSGADCTTDGGRLSAPGFLLVWTESVGTAHTFSPDQVRARVCVHTHVQSLCVCYLKSEDTFSGSHIFAGLFEG